MSREKLDVLIDSDPATRTIKIAFIFPNRRFDWGGTLDTLREIGYVEVLQMFARLIHERGPMTAEELGAAVGVSKTKAKAKNRVDRSSYFAAVKPIEFPRRFDLTDWGRETFGFPVANELPAWSALADGGVG